jgi:hypothetical protein
VLLKDVPNFNSGAGNAQLVALTNRFSLVSVILIKNTLRICL